MIENMKATLLEDRTEQNALGYTETACGMETGTILDLRRKAD